MKRKLLALMLSVCLTFGSAGAAAADDVIAEEASEDVFAEEGAQSVLSDVTEEAAPEEELIEAEADTGGEAGEILSDVSEWAYEEEFIAEAVEDAEVETAEELPAEDEGEADADFAEDMEDPGNPELVGAGLTVSSAMHEECDPYYLYYSYCQDSLEMGGITFTDAVKVYLYYTPRVGFNLGGLYDEISFYAGHADGTNTQGVGTVTMTVLADGTELCSQTLGLSDVAKKFTFPVSGVQQFEVTFKQSGIWDGCYFGIGGMDFVRSGLENGLGRAIASNMKEECEPYGLYKSGLADVLTMGSVTFADAVKCSLYYTPKVSFNLFGRYTSLSFYAGHVDGNSTRNVGTVTMNIYEEGELKDTQTVPVNNIPAYFHYNVTGVTQFEIEFKQSGNWDGCYYGIGGLMFLPESDHSGITIDRTVSGEAGTTVPVSGTLTLNKNEATASALEAAVNALVFETSDPAQAGVLACTYTPAEDFRSAELMIYTSLYEEGTPSITVTTAKGQTASCKSSITAAAPAQTYQTNYAAELRELLANEGTKNALDYLAYDSNFPASTFVYKTDSRYGSRLVQTMTDLYFRGWDGWRDLLDGSTSVEEAEKLLAGLLEAYQSDCRELALAKQSVKYANMISKGVDHFLFALSLGEALSSDQLETVKAFYSSDHIAKLLYEGKYNELKIGPNVALLAGQETPKEWNAFISGVMKCAEVNKALKDGIKTLGSGLAEAQKCLKLLAQTEDTVNYMFRMDAVLAADDMYREMLIYLRDNCYYSVVQEAAGNLLRVIDSGMQGVLEDLVGKAINLGGEKILDAAIDAATKDCMFYAIVKSGYDWGVTVSELLFHTSGTQEKKDKLRSLAYTGECLGRYLKEKRAAFESSGSEEAARSCYHGMYMVWQVRRSAEKMLQSMLKDCRSDWGKQYAVSADVLHTLETYRAHFFEKRSLAALIGVSVSCPVTLGVYDASGARLAFAGDGSEFSGVQNGVYYYGTYNPLTQDYMKQVFFPKDAGYIVKISGTGEGTADCSVVQVLSGGAVREQHIEDLPVQNGTLVTLSDPAAENVVYTLEDGASKSERNMQGPGETSEWVRKQEEKTDEGTGEDPKSGESLSETDEITPAAAKRANPMKVKAKTVTVKASKTAKKKQKIRKTKAFKITNAKGKVTFKKKSGSKKLSISKKGVITVRRGTKKGTYRIRVAVTAAGNAEYKAKTKTVRVRVRVK